jgi:hypothetical protein
MTHSLRMGLAGRGMLAVLLFSALATGGEADPQGSQGNVVMTPDNAFSEAAGFFPILPWGSPSDEKISVEQGLRSIAECNFTMAGFVRPQDLPICEELGLAALVRLGALGGSKGLQKLSPEEIDEIVRVAVEQAGESKALMGFYLCDEPGAEAFAALGKAVEAVKKYAPGKLAYINLFPDYATIGAPDISQLDTASYAEYLERYVAETKPQFISYDNYRVQYSNDLRDTARAKSYYTNLMEVRRVAREHGIPFWNIVSSNQIRPFTTIPSPANMLFQAYTTLAAGGRGVSWYTYLNYGYAHSPLDVTGNKTPTWRYLQMVNHHLKVVGPVMNGLTSTGLFFTPPAPVDALPVLPGSIVKEVQSDAPIMIGEFSVPNGARYAMAVNLSLERSTKVVLRARDDLRAMQSLSPEDGRWLPLEPESGTWLVAGQGVLIRFE